MAAKQTAVSQLQMRHSFYIHSYHMKNTVPPDDWARKPDDSSPLDSIYFSWENCDNPILSDNNGQMMIRHVTQSPAVGWRCGVAMPRDRTTVDGIDSKTAPKSGHKGLGYSA